MIKDIDALIEEEKKLEKEGFIIKPESPKPVLSAQYRCHSCKRWLTVKSITKTSGICHSCGMYAIPVRGDGLGTTRNDVLEALRKLV